MSPITTHVLDLTRGTPAAGIPVLLEVRGGKRGWKLLGKSRTDADGRAKDLFPGGRLRKGTYRLHFSLAGYARTHKRKLFFPAATIVFVVDDTVRHYHVPLLLSAYGYSTYRGS